MFYVYQLPVPRLTEGDRYFQEIVERAGKLICTSPEYDDLASALTPPAPLSQGARGETNSLSFWERVGVRDKEEREVLRAEIDAMVAHLYGLNEVEFKHILSTFPLVEEGIKEKTLRAFLQMQN